MRRRNDGRSQAGTEDVAQRLREERPEASPLELDRIKTTAMSRAKAGAGVGSRRFAVLALTVGLLAATTGGVVASGGAGQSPGNAAVAQYGNNCDVNNGGEHNGNGNGNENGSNGNNNGNNNGNCNENSFNTTITNNYAGPTNVTNNYTTVAATPGAGVLGSKTSKKATSSRHIRIHVRVPSGSKLRRVIVRVNGRRVKTMTGRKASANVELVNLPCSKGATTIEVAVTLSNGKTVTSRHTYHLCVG
jgi:hypothetical protein